MHLLLQDFQNCLQWRITISIVCQNAPERTILSSQDISLWSPWYMMDTDLGCNVLCHKMHYFKSLFPTFSKIFYSKDNDQVPIVEEEYRYAPWYNVCQNTSECTISSARFDNVLSCLVCSNTFRYASLIPAFLWQPLYRANQLWLHLLWPALYYDHAP